MDGILSDLEDFRRKMTGRRRMTIPYNPKYTPSGGDRMGLKDWFDRKRRGYTGIAELMNLILAWRLQHFVNLPDRRTPSRRRVTMPPASVSSADRHRNRILRHGPRLTPNRLR